jgi:TPR repeat protein
MNTNWVHSGIDPVSFAVISVAHDEQGANMLVANCLAAAAQGDLSAYFDLGVAFSTGSHGAQCDLIEAHKWFNLAAVAGHDEAQTCRAEISDEMTAREIAEAQRRARQWIATTSRRAA